jgi:hypothetical protein
MPESYPSLIAKLVAVQDALGREQGEVHAWYAAQLAAATEAVDRAAAAVERAGREVADAQEAVDRVDFAARRLWGDLGNRLSWRAAKRRGPVPGPVADPPPAGEQPDRLISQVRARLAAAPVVQVLAPWAYPLMALFGAACAAAVARVALALTAPGWTRIALLAAAPLLGLLPARLLARAQRSPLDPWSILLTLAAGAATVAALTLAG